MNDQQITQFFTELRTKVDEAEKRVKELRAIGARLDADSAK